MDLFIIFGVFVLFLITFFYLYRKKSSNLYLEYEISNEENPINKLTFEESLDLEIFNDQLIKFNLFKANEAIEKTLNISPGNGVKILESVKVIKGSDSIIWELSKEGKKLLKAGKVEWVVHKQSGKFLPVVKNAKGTKFKELIKGSKNGNIAHLAKIPYVVVNIAHIISGADLSKQIHYLKNEVRYLTAGRKIDKLSKLESLYYDLKEILADTNIEAKKEKIIEIHKQIRLIRITFRNELEYHLRNMDDPNARSFFKWLFSFDRNTDERVYNSITRFEEEMRLLDYCFALDFAICGAIDQDLSALNDELKRFKQTAELLKSKKNYLTGRFPEYNIDDHIEYLLSIPNKYKNYIFTDPLPKIQ